MTDLDAPVTLRDMLATGVTYRQLDYWSRTQRIFSVVEGERPWLTGSGYHRRWTRREHLIVDLMVRLTTTGINVENAAFIARQAVTDGRTQFAMSTGIIINVPDPKVLTYAMKKIPTLFLRDFTQSNNPMTEEVNPAARWVIDGEGTPTRKYDGTCVMYDGGRWWARREVKVGKALPPGFQAVDVDPDTHKVTGWEPVEQSGFRKAHAEALRHVDGMSPDGDATEPTWEPGTYELCGPKVNGNPEGYPVHTLVRHATATQIAPDAWSGPLTFARIRQAVFNLRDAEGWEGIVWHHPDGRMAKIKARDFQ